MGSNTELGATRTMVILFVDLLGVRSRWHAGGRAEAERAFVTLRTLVVAALREAGTNRPTAGGVETDASTLVFQSASEAISVGTTLYRLAFATGQTASDERLWLRGAIVPFEPAEPLRTERSLSPPYTALKYQQYAGSLLDAIAIEKSGIKGMRLIIDASVVTDRVCRQFRIPISTRYLIPFRRLNHSPYPPRIESGYRDVLWMASADEEDWAGLKQRMATRLRHSSHNPEELLQAAATQVVFHECNAMLHALRRRDLRSGA